MNNVLKLCKNATVISAFVAALVGCENYTANPVCSLDNAADPAGITGTYTLSFQDEDFTVETQEFRIDALEAPGTIAITHDGTATDAKICQVNGHLIQETYEEAVAGYKQERLYVTGMGLTTLPVMFDRNRLDAGSIPYEIIIVPETLKGLLGTGVSDAVERVVSAFVSGKDTQGILVDNSQTSPHQLMDSAEAGPVGLTLLRR